MLEKFLNLNFKKTFRKKIKKFTFLKQKKSKEIKFK